MGVHCHQLLFNIHIKFSVTGFFFFFFFPEFFSPAISFSPSVLDICLLINFCFNSFTHFFVAYTTIKFGENGTEIFFLCVEQLPLSVRAAHCE